MTRSMRQGAFALLGAGFVAMAITSGAMAATTGNGGTAALPALEPAGARYSEDGHVKAKRSDETIPYWSSQFTDPTNGTTYGYTMVGKADPRSSNPGTTTVGTDMTPLNIVFVANGGFSLNGADVISRTLGSPIFQSSNYSSTAHSGDQPPAASDTPQQLSLGNTSVQYEDAIMRSQFNKQGSSYHLLLGQPNVREAITLIVPPSKGSAYVNSLGVVYGLVDYDWFTARIQGLIDKSNQEHLAIFMTNNVMLYVGDTSNCCVIGFHGASSSNGKSGSSTNSSGHDAVQTFAYAAYTTPGTFKPSTAYYLKDVHALSHEIAEWGDDPFTNNYVNPWLTPTAPQYGCTDVLETGDPVVGIGFTLPGNSYDTNAYADGYWHPEDEVFLPWFAREAPNATSQAVQGGGGGRYTFMGNLNPYPGFQVPATGC
jgi:hypothetical protein